MRTIFDDRQVSISCDNKYSFTVTKNDMHYVPGNGKPEITVPFSEIGAIHVMNYGTSNGPYTIFFRDLNGVNKYEIDTDVKDRGTGHNILETKSILIAFAANKLTDEFPNNLDTLGVTLGFNLKEKQISLDNGVITGKKHQIKLADIKRVRCAAGGAINTLGIYTKEKGGFFDKPDMVVPANELTLPVLEAVMTRNTGHGIDFSKGNNWDQKTGEFIIVRYMDSSFFESAPGIFQEEWQKIAYNRIKSYTYDVQDLLEQ